MINREEAIDLLCQRVLRTREEVKEKWPIYADPLTGRWITSDDGDWCDGHWIEMLRMTGELKGRPELIEEAIKRTERIRYKLGEGKISGHRFYYTAARLWATERIDSMRILALAAAYTTRAMVLPSNGAIPIGTEMQKAVQLSGGSIVAVDALHPYMVLDWWAYKETGDEAFLMGARRMFEVFEEHFIRDDGSTVQFVEFDREKGTPLHKFVRQGYNDHSCWSRGHAWAIAGSLLALETLNERRFFELSKRLFDYWWSQCRDEVPPYDFNAPMSKETPVDTSASAIVISALARVLTSLEDEEIITYYSKKFESMLDTLLRYVIPEASHLPAGMLRSGCYDYTKNHASNHELIWGDFYLMEALYCLKKKGLPC